MDKAVQSAPVGKRVHYERRRPEEAMMFWLGALIVALEQVAAGGGVVTDESRAMERMGLVPRLVEGHASNIKITRPEDLAHAALYLRSQDQE